MAHSVWIFFLWTNDADCAGEGDCTAFGDLMLVDECCGISALDSVAHSSC